MLSGLTTAVKDACILNIVSDALLPGRDKPLWPIIWEQLAPLEQLQLCPTQGHSKDQTYSEQRLLLLLSMLVTASNFDSQTFSPPPWLTIHPLKYSSCPALLYKKGRHTAEPDIEGQGILGYIFYQPSCKRAYLVFTGTANGCMSMIDMDYQQVTYDKLLNYQETVEGHRGFYQAYLSIRPQIIELLSGYQNSRNLAELVICGHSLGGALSTVATFDLAELKPHHYNFAGPRVFNVAGANLFNQLVHSSCRVTNSSDIVPTMPMSVMPNGNSFNHVGTICEFQHNMGNYSDNHSLAYLFHFQLVEKVAAAVSDTSVRGEAR